MKLTVILILATCLQINARSIAQNYITLSEKKAPLKKILKEIKKQSGVAFFYDEELIKKSNPVDIIVKNATLKEALTMIFQNQELAYEIISNKIITIKEREPQQIEKVTTVQITPVGIITGMVTDEKGVALQGASVRAKGSEKGTTTNADGKFRLVVKESDKVLIISFTGYSPMEMAIGKNTGNSEINVQMFVANAQLEGVVVTALGIKREARALSYSQQGIDVNSLNENKSPNTINSLSGKVAGLQVIPPGFNTGSARVIIRGNNSLTGNNQPLFIVDGMPIDNNAGDAGSLDYGNNAADINPADIEDIQVLKGPNAAALYGSRAANGAILITTKKGSTKFKVSLNSNEMFQTLSEFPEYQNAYGVGTSFYIDNTNRIPVAAVNYRSWGSPMLGQPYVALNGQIKPYLPHPDNIKDFYSTAHLYTNSVAIEGGNTNSTYRLGYTNYTGTSVVEGLNKDNKHSIDLRLINIFTKWMTMDSKINFIHDIVNNREYPNSNGRNPANSYTQMARSTDLSELTPYEDPLTGMEIGTHRNFSNPYWIINKNPNKDTKDRVIASFSPQIAISPWLKFTGRLGVDLIWWDGFEFNDIGSVVAGNPNGYMKTFNTKQGNLNLEGFFSINKKIKDFSFVTILGASSFASNYENRQIAINSLLQPGLINLSNAKEYPITTQSVSNKKLNSVYGDLSLGYHNYAFLDLTGRNDWSSTLPTGNNSYFYPSLGGSLVITDMLHLKSKFLNFAKARASVAMVGNDTDPYRLNKTFSFNGFFNGATLASLATTMNNPDLKPEKTASTEFGLDLRILNNKISISATHYNSATTNQIVTAQLPASSGYQQRIYNAGKIRNWGNELSINARIIENKNFSWQAQFNYSKNNSLVVSLIDGVDRFVLNNNSSYIYVYAQVGKPYAYLRGLGVARDSAGHMLLDGVGGLLTKNPDEAFGTANPDWLAGLSNTFRYKNFTLSFLIDVKKGGVLYSGSYSRMLTNGIAAETLYGRNAYYQHSVIFGENPTELSGGAMWNAYFANGTKNTTYISPQSYEYARPNYAEFVMFDASYVKLREVSIGYNLPAKLLTKTIVKSARFSLAGRNLAILYRKTPVGIDPEAASTSGNGQGIENGALPPNAIYGFNCNLTF